MPDLTSDLPSDLTSNPLENDAGRVVELRGDRRASLMIRSAKLVCQSGEYPCVVRDVSSGGVKLRHFQAMPPETYVLLELSNGDTYAMLRVWNRAMEAGYRFLTPIAVESFINERHDHPRRPIRLRLRHNATVWSEGKPVQAIVRNISQGGVGVELATELALRQPVRLSLPGIPECYARVAWRRSHAHGLVFERSLTMDELARYALDLQPFLAPDAMAQAPHLFHEPPVRRATA